MTSVTTGRQAGGPGTRPPHRPARRATQPAARRRRGGSTEGEGGPPLLHFGKLESPLTTYYLLLGVTTTLVVFGLIMVFSASSVEALLEDDAFYTDFARQLLFAVVGAAVAAWAARWPVRWWRRVAGLSLVGAVALQAAVFVPGLGVEVQGNLNWLDLGFIQIQPSEFAKIALVLTGAAIFANKGALVGNWLHAILPYVLPISAVVLALVLGGHDLGTGLVMGLIVGAVLFVAGAPKRLFVLGGAGILAGIAESSARVDQIASAATEQLTTSQHVATLISTAAREARHVSTATAEQATALQQVVQSTTRMRTATQEVARVTADQGQSAREIMKAANVPPAFVIIQRINLGLYAVLGELGATANWRRITEEIWPWYRRPPSTPLGEQEAAWLAGTAE